MKLRACANDFAAAASTDPLELSERVPHFDRARDSGRVAPDDQSQRRGGNRRHGRAE